MADLYQECDTCVFAPRVWLESPCRECYLDGCPHRYFASEDSPPTGEGETSPEASTTD